MATISDLNDAALDRFYIQEDPQISEQTRIILTQYSGINEDRIIRHIRNVRDRAWQSHKYPCIGLYNFLEFGIGTTPRYEEALRRLKRGEKLLDLGCCMGQDIRKLVFDGAPAENITASELEPEFIELGFDLFLDKDQLTNATFTTGDFFAPEEARLKPGSFDMIHASSFFQLFSWSAQAEALSLALRLLKSKPGCLIFGRQTGSRQTGTLRYKTTRSEEMFRHNPESFKKWAEEVGAKMAVNLVVEVESYTKPHQKELEDWLMLKYSIMLQ